MFDTVDFHSIDHIILAFSAREGAVRGEAFLPSLQRVLLRPCVLFGVVFCSK